MLWGLYHGILLTLEKYVWGKGLAKLPKLLQHLYAIVIVVFGFGIFTFDDMTEMGQYFPQLIGLPGNAFFGSEFVWYAGNYLPFLLTAIVLAFPVYPWFRKKMEKANIYRKNTLAMCGGLLMIVLLLISVASLVRDTYNPFLYFRF